MEVCCSLDSCYLLRPPLCKFFVCVCVCVCVSVVSGSGYVCVCLSVFFLFILGLCS